MIPNSESNFLDALHVLYLALLRTWLTGYSTLVKNNYGKLTIYQSDLASSAMENQFQIYRAVTSYPLSFDLTFFLYQNKFNVLSSYVWLKNDSNEQKYNVMRKIPFMVIILLKNI